MSHSRQWSLNDPYNPELGLWTQSKPGHTKPIAHLPNAHSGPNAIGRLLVAAQQGRLADFPVDKVLSAVSKLQVRDNSDQHGCCRWYAEEPHPVDTNASFFISLNLIVLNAAYREQFNESQQASIDEMLEAFVHWFAFEAEDGKVHYPNKYLGDLVCLWLLREQTGQTTAELVPIYERAADYWLNDNWGWGEHLSDPYASILLDELSCFLLFTKNLPETVHAKYLALFKELIQIEDQFEGGPRVPTIRTYAFRGQIEHSNYRNKIQPVSEENFPEHNSNQFPSLYVFPFGHSLKNAGWDAIAPPRMPMPDSGVIDCYGGAQAYFFHQDTLRYGALSQYPIMPNTDQSTWGLSWQTMPIAISNAAGDWGYWRWSTLEGERERHHPAKNKATAYLSNALSDITTPAISAHTFSQTNQRSIITLRRMPRLSKLWDWCTDSFTLHDFSGSYEVIEHSATGWYELKLTWPGGERLSICFHPLEHTLAPELSSNDSILEWKLHWTSEDVKLNNKLSGLWIVSPDESIGLPELKQRAGWYPTLDFTPGDAAWTFQFGGSDYAIDESGLKAL